MTRKLLREKWSYLTAAHGQCSTVSESTSSAFSLNHFLRLTDGEIHKETKILASMQRWKNAPFNICKDSYPISKPPDMCHHHKLLFSVLQYPGNKGCNNHLTGRWPKIFLVQNSSCSTEDVTYVFLQWGSPWSTLKCSSVGACFFSSSHAADALILLITSWMLQKSDVTRSGWIAVTLCSEAAIVPHSKRCGKSQVTACERPCC